jgi:hypothetical protein
VRNRCRNWYPLADFPVFIRTMPNWITSESPTIRRELLLKACYGLLLEMIYKKIAFTMFIRGVAFRRRVN